MTAYPCSKCEINKKNLCNATNKSEIKSCIAYENSIKNGSSDEQIVIKEVINITKRVYNLRKQFKHEKHIQPFLTMFDNKVFSPEYTKWLECMIIKNQLLFEKELEDQI